MNETIRDLKGQPIKVDEKELRVKEVLANIIASGFMDMKPLDNVRAYQLSSRLISSDKENIEVNQENVELIKKCFETNRNGYLPIVIGQVLLLSGLENSK